MRKAWWIDMANLNYNRVILAGRLTGDPETKMTNSGMNMVTCNLAVNRPKKDGREQETDFFRCLAWGKTAEMMARYFRKGSSMMVEGSIQTGSYTDKQGVKRYTTDIVCDRLHFVDTRAEAERIRPVNQTAAPAEAPVEQYVPAAYGGEQQADFTELVDDLPF